MKPDFLPESRQRKTFSDFDLTSIAILLEAGFTIEETLPMIESKKNKALIQQLLSCFDAGEKAADCFPAFCPVSWRSYLEGFLASTDFAQAFFLTRHLQETRDELQKNAFQTRISFAPPVMP